MSILDLPIEEQKKYAEDEGMSYEDWLAEVKMILNDKVEEPIRLTGKEAEEYLKEHYHFYQRTHS